MSMSDDWRLLEDCDEWDDEDDEWRDIEDDEDYWLQECGWVRGQGCTMAGSEECDFECPFRRDFERGMTLTRARLAKRAAQQKGNADA